MSAFSPGPWSAKPDRLLRAAAIVSASGLIATTSGAQSRETSVANATLIAAAPDLYSALRTAVSLIDPLIEDGDQSLVPALQKMLAALEKADGVKRP